MKQISNKEAFSIVEVNSANLEDLFLNGINHLYKNDENWVPYLEMDLKNIFSSKSNKLFEQGGSKRWIAIDNSGKTVLGRIAAFYNEKKASASDVRSGGIGFYECVDDENISKSLFYKACNWLEELGMQAVDGPINFGENFNYWGLHVDGNIMPMYGMHYHNSYYKKHFEDYGFKNYFEQYSFRIKPSDVPQRIFNVGKWVEEKGHFHSTSFSFKEKEKLSADIAFAFNKIWSSFKKDFTPIDSKGILAMLEDAKFIIDENLINIVYHNNEPISFAIMIPDVNQLIKFTDGKMNLWNIAKMLFYKYSGRINRVRSLVIGVSPEYQKKGIEAYMFYQIHKLFDNSKYKEVEFSWIGDFNKKMLSFIDKIQAEKVSTHVTYRKMLDQRIEFRRYDGE